MRPLNSSGCTATTAAWTSSSFWDDDGLLPRTDTAGVREAFTVGGKTVAAALMVLIASLRALLPLGVDLTSAKLLPMREVPARLGASRPSGHRLMADLRRDGVFSGSGRRGFAG
ncbi:hypothetical protein [Streptomyces aureus]|uniref:hypothetical protein n=1 Tax=Streptomyces aureus TaxID=193461 RepID=UPI000D14F1F3|nr:hypothetical protein [Streptomyces aureus]